MSSQKQEPPEAFYAYLFRERPFLRVDGVFYSFVDKVVQDHTSPSTIYRCRYARVVGSDVEMDAMAAHISGSDTCITLPAWLCFQLSGSKSHT